MLHMPFKDTPDTQVHPQNVREPQMAWTLTNEPAGLQVENIMKQNHTDRGGEDRNQTKCPAGTPQA